MKTVALSLIILLSLALTSVSAQQRVTESRILGEWTLMINIEDEIRKEAETEDSALARAFMRGLSGFIQSVLDDIEISLTFQINGIADLLVITNEKVSEQEELQWHINARGQLIIDDFKSEKVSISNNGYWMFDGKKLISFDSDGTLNKNVWMQR